MFKVSRVRWITQQAEGDSYEVKKSRINLEQKITGTGKGTEPQNRGMLNVKC